MSDSRCNESEEAMVGDVALEELSQKESVGRPTTVGGRSVDEESASPVIQRDVEIVIHPQEEFDAQRKQAHARGSKYTNIWSASKET